MKVAGGLGAARVKNQGSGIARGNEIIYLIYQGPDFRTFLQQRIAIKFDFTTTGAGIIITSSNYQ